MRGPLGILFFYDFFPEQGLEARFFLLLLFFEYLGKQGGVFGLLSLCLLSPLEIHQEPPWLYFVVVQISVLLVVQTQSVHSQLVDHFYILALVLQSQLFRPVFPLRYFLEQQGTYILGAPLPSLVEKGQEAGNRGSDVQELLLLEGEEDRLAEISLVDSPAQEGYHMMILIFGTVSTQANLRITQPKTAALEFPQGIVYTLGNIGRVPYGQVVTAPLQLANPFDFCALDSERSLDHDRILLAVRGNCSFTTKLSNAQRVQAKLLIVTDNITQGSRNWVDDGKGGYLKTPIIFISHEDGLKLAQLSRKNHLTLSINFEQGKREVVRLDLLLTTADRHSYILVRQIAPLLKSLLHQIELNVYFYSFTCPRCPPSDCFGKGQYCLVDLSNRNYQDGQLLLLEQVRSSIILQQNLSIWLDYMNMYDGHCSQDYHPQCSQKIMKAIGINNTKIDQLVNQSFSQGIAYQSQNSLLENQRAFVKNSGTNQVPWLLVNGQVYKGYLNQYGMSTMICNGFKSLPKSCQKFMDKGVAQPGHIVLFVVLISAIVILGFVLLAILMKKCKSSGLSQQIQNKISQTVGRLGSMRKTEKPDLRQLIDKLDRYEPSQRL